MDFFYVIIVLHCIIKVLMSFLDKFLLNDKELSHYNEF